MIDETTVPTLEGPEAVTAEWLSAALSDGAEEVEVHSFHREAIAEGMGMMSALAMVVIDEATGPAPDAVVLKMPATNAQNLAVADAFQLYRREVLFYRDLAERSSARTPAIHHAALGEGSDFVLLMEDLSEHRLGDQVEGCGLDEALQGMTWLGRHHASFWDRVDDPSLEFLPYVWPSYSSDALAEGCAAGWPVMVEVFGDVLPERMCDLRDAYLAAQPALFEHMATPPLTVVHGDFRMDNLFFARDDGSGGGETLIAVDWQGSLRGRATQDIGYFMSGSVRTEVRRDHERDLIARWHDELVDGGVSGYSPDDAWEDYRRGVAYVWTLAVVISGTLDPTNERGREWMSKMLERSVAAFDDLDLYALVEQMASSRNP